MMQIILYLSTLIVSGNMILFDFNKESSIKDWQVVDDTVMGGQSDGNFKINSDGNAIYYGDVSLENNGGFSSVRYRFDEKDVSNYNKVLLYLKGDGKRYQFRVKSSQYDRHSYIYHFQTTGKWEVIEIQLVDLAPQFRGRKLDMPNYSPDAIEELAFLIGNKSAENFQLELDKIILE